MNVCVSHVVCIVRNCSQSNSRHHLNLSMITCEFPFPRILKPPSCMTSHVCISMHMHNSCFINSCMIILTHYTCVKAHTWHVFATPLNFGSHLPMVLEINSSQKSPFCMNMQYFVFMTHGEYFCLCDTFLIFCMTWVQSLHPCSLSSSLSHDVLSLLFQSNCPISQELLAQSCLNQSCLSLSQFLQCGEFIGQSIESIEGSKFQGLTSVTEVLNRASSFVWVLSSVRSCFKGLLNFA